MERNDFIARMATAPSDIDRARIIDIIRRGVDYYLPDGFPRGTKNMIISMEECAELSKEISKTLRGRGTRLGLVEEMGDVLLAVMYIQEITGITDEELHKAMNIKMEYIESMVQETAQENGRAPGKMP